MKRTPFYRRPGRTGQFSGLRERVIWMIQTRGRPVTGKPVSGNNKGSMLIIWRPYPRTHCHFATVDRDELMAFGAKLLARREAA